MANSAYDVFISYARVDGRHAADIDSILRAKGLSPFFDRRSFAPGLPWLRALEQVIGSAKSAIVLIGPHGLGNTQQYERELALIRQTGDQAFPVVPVILPGNKSDPPFDFLRLLSWIDFSHVDKVSDAPDVLEQLLAAIHGREIAPESAREAICPYRGLDAYREEDSAFFIGRGSADDPNSPIGELLRKVREHPFVMVVGRSGSGKSSLVYAGLLPALRRERDRFWNVLSLRPGPTPLHALAAAFNPRAENEGAADYQSKIINEANKLRTGDPELLSYMIREELGRAEGKPDRLLLYIDQWEELYAQAPSSNDKARAAQHAADVNRFIDLLLAASRSAPVAVVGTVRADFYDPLIGHEEIKSLLPTRQVLLGKMNRSGLEQTIVEPAKKVRLTFDPPDLVQRILDEAGEDDGMLPLLQYALKETWKNRKGDVITADSYARSGGVREAIRVTAEQTFKALSAGDQQAARQLFLRLVTPGEGQEDTRARAAMPVEETQRKIVEKFAGPGARLLVTGQDRAARPTVEVAHEALIRTWPRLRQWIDASREKLRSRAAILQAKTQWEQEGRREDLLLPAGFQLERARALLAEPGDITTDDIKDYISLSSAREAVEKKQREEALARDEARVAEIKTAQARTSAAQAERETALYEAEQALKQAADAQRKRASIRNVALVVVSMFAVLAGWLYLRADRLRQEAEEQTAFAKKQTALAEEQKAFAQAQNTGATIIISSLQTKMDEDTKKEATALFRRSAAHGDSNAMRNLGVSYRDGLGIAQDYEQAREWFEKAANNDETAAMVDLGRLYADGEGVAKDYAKARAWYEKAAAKDNIDAMVNLGWLYANGQSGMQDYVKARHWYEKAAAKDNTSAMLNLAQFYANGQGGPQDYAKARQWYEKAAANDNTDAMLNLGLLYENGRGVTQDYAKAHEWFEKAAKDDSWTMFSLGLRYQNGRDVAQDYAKAREWYEKAAGKGSVSAMTSLGHLYANGYGVAQDYAKAREWYEKAAAKDDRDAMINLGLLYENGRDVAQDYAKAHEWFEKAAKDDSWTMVSLGLRYENGRDVAQDYAKAREWYQKAAGKENTTAMLNLGRLYENAQGGMQDYAKAREWYEKAAGKGDASAMTSLGALYANGYGVAKDYAIAREWFEKAAAKQDSYAMANLGWLHENGRGVPQDYSRAREWYEKAAAQDNTGAMINLGALYEGGHGVTQDYARAREWYERAAAKNDTDAMPYLEQLPIRAAAGAGRYAEALQLQEALSAKAEAAGKPAAETAQALNGIAWWALFVREFTKALAAADRAHALAPDYLMIETNRAHALMFLGRGEEAKTLYLAHKGESVSGQDGKPWDVVIREDFMEFRKAGLTHPMMADIEKELSVAH
jgi:hypothetical protein